jgi:4-amino-4-deoxy-L-arabinose transferase-like glycosyltransferase
MSWTGRLPFRAVVLAALVVPLALALRWGGDAEAKGSRFHPWPDAVEYAAEAQALARTGQAFLQVGPYRVRPRYPPGWPLLLAAAIRLGVEGRDLWRITALFGAALAWLLATVAAATTEALMAPDRRSRGIAPLLAGLLAGGLWAVAPVAVDLGQTLMSDEPTALVCLLGLLLAGLAFLRPNPGTWALALGGGLAFGLAAAMRSVAGLLMLLPLAGFLLASLRRSGLRATLPLALAWALGAAVVAGLVVLIQLRSGWPAWQWSGYAFWMPVRFAHWTSPFELHTVFSPDEVFPREVAGRPISHLDLAGRVLLGIPGLPAYHDLGFFWPLAGWLAALPLYRLARRRGGEAAAAAACLEPAFLLWTLAHVAVFSLYFFPSSRFYLAPLALSPVLLAIACGVGLSRSRGVASVCALCVVLLAAWGLVALRREPPPEIDSERTLVLFDRWRGWSDEERARQRMPFDPVHAQALGLLTPEVASSIRVWGELADTIHARRLKANGFLAAAPAAGRPSSPGPVR